MSFGQLSRVFSCFAWKQLTAVEVDPNASNGHEFNASKTLRNILGDNIRKSKDGHGIPTRFIYLTDEDEDLIQKEGFLSWYDARANHPNRTEWRLYYTDNEVIGREGRSNAGDSLIIAFEEDIKSATLFVAPAGSTAESQLRWFFGITGESEKSFETALINNSHEVNFARAGILEAAGIELIVKDDELLLRMLELYGEKFPTTIEFGKFIRNEVSNIKAEEGADAAIMSWMESEEFAFRVFERYFVTKKLDMGFKDVDDFVSYSLSVHNRRKSRAGHAFENHLQEVFRHNGLTFERGVTLEAKAKPDFLFPGKSQYFDNSFSVDLLTLLGAKTTCKDRWRQVLAESSKVQKKHLVTLQPAITSDQLSQMRAHKLQLILPQDIHDTYPTDEKQRLWNLSTFIDYVLSKQKAAEIPLDYTNGIRVANKRKR